MKPLWEYVEKKEGWDPNHTPIRINRGRYSGMIYVYGRVQFPDKLEGARKLNLKFTYQILENPKNRKITQKFIDHIGGILVEIMDKECENLEPVTQSELEREQNENSVDDNGGDLVDSAIDTESTVA